MWGSCGLHGELERDRDPAGSVYEDPFVEHGGWFLHRLHEPLTIFIGRIIAHAFVTPSGNHLWRM